MTFKGYRTVIFGASVAIFPALLDYLGLVDWATLGVSPAAGAAIGAAIMALRGLTTTPLGVSA
jgi:hypothetical protein